MNVTELRDDLIQVYKDLKDGKIGIQDAKARANVSGKIISSAKVQMEYSKMTGDNKNGIKFLQGD